MTLIESCVAAAVVSTFMAISAPSLLRAKENYALQAAAREVTAKLHAARIAAITRNEDCRVTVTSGISYVVECQPSLIWETVEVISMHDDITITANNRPEFHRRGNVSPTATFTLRNVSGKTAQVIVNVNGRVKLQ